MTTLGDRHLPEEIIDNICASADRNTLFNICCASKTLNRIATARLYSHIQLGHLGYTGEEDSYIIQLAYLFFKSPSHAALVSFVDVLGTWGRMEENVDWCDKLSWPESGSSETEELLRTTCAKFATTNEERDELYSAIESGTQEDAILALLLASLPNLRRLDIDFGCNEEHEEFVRLFEKLCGKNMMPDRSKPVPVDVLVRGDDEKYPHDPTHLATFFHLPNVRAIYAYKMGNEEGELDLQNGPFARLRPRACPVEIIELRKSKIDRDNLKLLMGATMPGKLKTFNYEIGCTWAWCSVDHPAIMESLSVHHNTLENLGLSHEDFYPYQFGNDSHRPDPCSFVPFTALKRLKVAPVYIWGHDGFHDSASLGRAETRDALWQALPKNLEELWIARAQHALPPSDPDIQFEPVCLLPSLARVLEHKTESFPNLSNLRIEFSMKQWQTEWLDALAKICERAETYGIRCTIILTHVEKRPSQVELNWGWNEDVEWRSVYSNQEVRKHCVVVADEEDLAQTLRNLTTELDAE
ncbi:hypothetical protein DE146DRAFT_241312 [Phaeosphaeria sp. MPI-PUGE-AT-0046c]|nr:hypothetical protein DE146DRAFT_241312 [Phaeosphaeria sp. MPI-PUGE-AT-0046c]